MSSISNASLRRGAEAEAETELLCSVGAGGSLAVLGAVAP